MYLGKIMSDDSQRKPLQNVTIKVYDTISPYYLIAAGGSISGKPGLVKVATSNKISIDLLEKKKRGETASGIDIVFGVGCPTSAYKRPVVINRQGLYCEGRSPVFVEAGREGDLVSEERFIPAAIVQNKPQMLSGTKHVEGFKQLLKSDASVVLITGKPGVGKTTFVGKFIEDYAGQWKDFDMICCHSFEKDSSCRNFIDFLFLWLSTRSDLKKSWGEPTPDMMRQLLGILEPSLLVIDGIDEMSNSGRDHGWRPRLEEAVKDCVRGQDRMRGHSIILTSQKVPPFLETFMTSRRKSKRFLHIDLGG